VANVSCVGFTFSAEVPSPTACVNSPCKTFFKSQINLNTDSAWGTWLKYPMAHPPNPHRTDPACYSAFMFGSEAVRVIRAHAAEEEEEEEEEEAAGEEDAAPLFLYLAMQVHSM
jgi:hypothetical protein